MAVTLSKKQSPKQYYGSRRRNEGLQAINYLMKVYIANASNPDKPMLDAARITSLTDVVSFLSCVLGAAQKPFVVDCSTYNFPPAP